MLDLHSDTRALTAMIPRRVNANATTEGSIIDLHHALGVEFIFALGTAVDAAADIQGQIWHSDSPTMAGATQVPQELLIGDLAVFKFLGTFDNQVRQIGYKGNKRYVQIRVVVTENTGGNIDFAAVAFIRARKKPNS